MTVTEEEIALVIFEARRTVQEVAGGLLAAPGMWDDGLKLSEAGGRLLALERLLHDARLVRPEAKS